MINEQKLDEVLLELGFDDYCRGTAQLRTAVKNYDPGVMMGLLYGLVAKYHGTTPSRTERAIRHVIEKAFMNTPLEVLHKHFGNAINPRSGKMTNSQVVARLARICREN